LKKVCFVVSHLGSGSESLAAALNAHPQCTIHESGVRYESASSLRWLFRAGHKCRDASAVYGDHLIFNSSISSRHIYRVCRFIFVIRPARHSLEEIMSAGYSAEGASSYYRFRLRRICEIAALAPSRMILEWDDLAKEETSDRICEYLGIYGPMDSVRTVEKEGGRCPEGVISDCQDAYERYHYYLRRLKE